MVDKQIALIVGSGPGLSASLARLFEQNGMDVAMASRDSGKLLQVVQDTGARAFECDASEQAHVEKLFADVTEQIGVPDVVVYNPSYRTMGPVADLDPAEVEKALMISCFGGFLVGQAAARLMTERGSGSILFTGASASVKGYPGSAPFAMGKFGLRGLAQSMARELAPKGVHVAHFVIDGGIRKGKDDDRLKDRGEDALLDPDAIAESYLHVHRQHRSAWTWEMELRPWLETF